MMYRIGSLRDQIIALFVAIDDLLKLVPETPKIGKKAGRNSVLSEAEIITLGLIQHLGDFRNKKAYYHFLFAFCRDLFPVLPAYQNFVKLTTKRAYVLHRFSSLPAL